MSGPKPARRSRRPNVGRVLVLIAVLVATSYGGWWGYNRFLLPDTATASTRITTQDARRGNVVATVSSSGTVSAINSAKLSVQGGGVLAEIYVKIGDRVKTGQPLAKIDTRDLEIALMQQKANVTSAQAKLSSTLASPLDTDVQAAVSGISQAQTSLARAQADYQKLVTPLSGDDLQTVTAGLEKARAALQKAQTAYDQVSWRNDAGSSQQALDLQTATADYNTAMANYNLKIAPPKDADVQASALAVESAQKGLDSANAKLTSVMAGAKAEDITTARASIEVATAQLAAAQLKLDRAVLTAPFDGVVNTINSAVGEVVSASFITLVDVENLRLDVAVDENDVSKIELNQPAVLTFDALAGRTYNGKVIAVAPAATIVQGVATFNIAIQIERPERVKPGMTANVSITYDSRNDVLLVPNRAIKVANRNVRTVDIETPGGAIETRTVSVGLSNDSVTEITRGLSEGEKVVIAATTTRPSTNTVRPPGATGAQPVIVGR